MIDRRLPIGHRVVTTDSIQVDGDTIRMGTPLTISVVPTRTRHVYTEEFGEREGYHFYYTELEAVPHD